MSRRTRSRHRLVSKDRKPANTTVKVFGCAAKMHEPGTNGGPLRRVRLDNGKTALLCRSCQHEMRRIDQEYREEVVADE